MNELHGLPGQGVFPLLMCMSGKIFSFPLGQKPWSSLLQEKVRRDMIQWTGFSYLLALKLSSAPPDVILMGHSWVWSSFFKLLLS